MKTVIITEKPSMTKKYTVALKEFKNIVVVNSIGHIEELQNLQFYLGTDVTNWYNLINKLPFVPNNFELSLTNKNQYDTIKRAVKDASEIVLACDPDREGELIHRNILQLLKNDGVVKTNNITRVWLHSETNAGIKEGFLNRQNFNVYEGYYKAASTRSKVDWLLGIQFTVLYTVKFGKPKEVLSVGRVQSWLLSEIVKRTIQFNGFKPKDFGIITFKSENDILFNLVDEENKIFKFFDLIVFSNTYQNLLNKPLKIQKIVKTPYTEFAPKLYDLNSLSRDAAKYYDISPEQTLKIAQTLYEEKELITYPRTDCNVLSEQEAAQLPKVIDLLNLSHQYQSLLAEVSKQNPNYILNKKYVGEIKGHFAIIPVYNYSKNAFPSLSADEKKIFDLIVYRLCNALMEPEKGEKTQISAQIEGVSFFSEVKKITHKGYKALSIVPENPGNTNNSVSANVNLFEGQILKGTLEQKKDKTKPEPLFKDDTILALMEKAHLTVQDKLLREQLKQANGIGTASTRASFIPTLIKRDYITKKGKDYIPTQKGYELFNVLPNELKNADYSAKLEYQLNSLIQQKDSDCNPILNETKTLLHSIFSHIKLAEHKFSSPDLGTCPNCNSPIVAEKFSFSCQNRKQNKCDFKVSNTIAGKTITTALLASLLSKKKTPLIKGFTAKSGKKFDAHLVLNSDSSVTFEFPKK